MAHCTHVSPISLKACEIPRSVLKTVNKVVHACWYYVRLKKRCVYSHASLTESVSPRVTVRYKTRQQTQNSGTKNRGVSIEYRGVCVWNIWVRSTYEKPKYDIKPKTQKQTSTVTDPWVPNAYRAVQAYCVQTRQPS